MPIYLSLLPNDTTVSAPKSDLLTCHPSSSGNTPRRCANDSQDMFASSTRLNVPISSSDHCAVSRRAIVDRVIAHLWAPSTSKRYSFAVEDFIKFCKLHEVLLNCIWPASEDLLCFYAASMAGTLAGGTISNKISGLHFYHIQHNMPWRDSIRLRHTVKEVENLRPEASFQKEQPPITLKMLQRIKTSLDLFNP